MTLEEKYQADIGLEVHVELATKSKIFCACPTRFGAFPNTQVCPVCMGLPGVLPTLNKKAVELAVTAGLATDCQIAKVTGFDRKNYFYPDLPKAYQITQNDLPICVEGHVDITVNGESRRIGIQRIHIEEDAGKLAHSQKDGTLVDYNRCGVPLIEIVSYPDMHSAEEAKEYLAELRRILLYAEVSDCKMNEGSFRCDVNLSVRKKGDEKMGVRAEMKNINSFSFAAKAIEYEFIRQATLLENGGEVLPETRRFDPDTGKTYPMRVKETAADYRFFSEPDLPCFDVPDALVSLLRQRLPRLPKQLREEYVSRWGLTPTDSEIIISRPPMAKYFEEAAALTDFPKTVANLMISELLSQMEAESFDTPVSARSLAEVANLYGEGTVNSSTVKKLLQMLEQSELSPRELVEKYGLAQINDEESIKKILLKVIEENPKLLADYKNGKTAAKKAIIGKIMAATGGKANPTLANKIFENMTD